MRIGASARRLWEHGAFHGRRPDFLARSCSPCSPGWSGSRSASPVHGCWASRPACSRWRSASRITVWTPGRHGLGAGRPRAPEPARRGRARRARVGRGRPVDRVGRPQARAPRPATRCRRRWPPTSARSTWSSCGARSSRGARATCSCCSRRTTARTIRRNRSPSCRRTPARATRACGCTWNGSRWWCTPPASCYRATPRNA